MKHKNTYKAKYQFLINIRESTGLMHGKESKMFIEYWYDMGDVYKNTEEYNPRKECKILIILGDTIADMLSNKKLNPRVTEFFIRDRKLFLLILLHNCLLYLPY